MNTIPYNVHMIISIQIITIQTVYAHIYIYYIKYIYIILYILYMHYIILYYIIYIFYIYIYILYYIYIQNDIGCGTRATLEAHGRALGGIHWRDDWPGIPAAMIWDVTGLCGDGDFLATMGPLNYLCYFIFITFFYTFLYGDRMGQNGVEWDRIHFCIHEY